MVNGVATPVVCWSTFLYSSSLSRSLSSNTDSGTIPACAAFGSFILIAVCRTSPSKVLSLMRISRSAYLELGLPVWRPAHERFHAVQKIEPKPALAARFREQPHVLGVGPGNVAMQIAHDAVPLVDHRSVLAVGSGWEHAVEAWPSTGWADPGGISVLSVLWSRFKHGRNNQTRACGKNGRIGVSVLVKAARCGRPQVRVPARERERERARQDAIRGLARGTTVTTGANMS